LTNQLFEAEEREKDVSAQHDRLQQDVMELQDQLDELTKTNSDKKARLRQDQDAIKMECANLRLGKRVFESEIQSNQLAINDLNAASFLSERELGESKSKLATLVESDKRKRDENSELSGKIESAKRELKKVREQSLSWSEQLKDARLRLSAAEDAAKVSMQKDVRAKSRLNEAISEQNELSEQVPVLRGVQVQLQGEFNSKVEEARQERAAVDRDANDSKNKLIEVSQAAKEQNQQHAAARKELDDYSSQLNQYTEAIARLKVECSSALTDKLLLEAISLEKETEELLARAAEVSAILNGDTTGGASSESNIKLSAAQLQQVESRVPAANDAKINGERDKQTVEETKTQKENILLMKNLSARLAQEKARCAKKESSANKKLEDAKATYQQYQYQHQLQRQHHHQQQQQYRRPAAFAPVPASVLAPASAHAPVPAPAPSRLSNAKSGELTTQHQHQHQYQHQHQNQHQHQQYQQQQYQQQQYQQQQQKKPTGAVKPHFASTNDWFEDNTGW